MSDGFSPQQSANPFQAPPTTTPPQRRSSLVWGIGIGCLACTCLCGGPCILLTGFGVYQAVSQRDEVEKVIDASLSDIAAQRPDEVLARTSKRAIEHEFITREKLEKLGENPAFRGYKSATVTNINVSATYNSDPKVPQGTVANVSGTVEYDDGGKGTFQATLERENGEWRLFSLKVDRDAESPPVEKSDDDQN
jgi:hypothetical protein